MKKKTKIGLWAASAVAVLCLVWAGGNILQNSGVLNYMRGFTVQVENQTEHDIVIVEAGLVSGDSKDTINRTIKSGERLSFKPNLELAGENGVYMNHTNASGEIVTTGVCGYTETLSGSAKVVIGEAVTVEQNCY
ncbi:hypothetical protein [Paenibacillus sp. NPDC057967]|uniref:hypothetical protein n=1 Tax=Paenibacillus sp. NPDC057967 TaxID=3346293 RepID=UPI0036DBB45C